MSFFWPTNPKTDPGVLARAGRVLHWTALAFALALAATGLASFNSAGTDPALGWLCLALAAAFTLAGRGLRYILAGE